MSIQELRKLTDYKLFYPHRIAEGLRSAINGIPDDAFNGKLIAVCVYEERAPVDPREMNIFVVWDDSFRDNVPPFKDQLDRLIRASLNGLVKSLEIEYITISEIFKRFILGNETIYNRLKKSIVLYDQETIVPLKALLEMRDEWYYQPFKNYIKSALLTDKDKESVDKKKLDVLSKEFSERIQASGGFKYNTVGADAILGSLAKLYAKFEEYVECIVEIPEDPPIPFKRGNLILVINDTDVETMERVVLKLKIQAIVHSVEEEYKIIGTYHILLLTELVNIITNSPTQFASIIEQGRILYDKGTWKRFNRMLSQLLSAKGVLESDRFNHRILLWDVDNVPLWLGKLSPNYELRGYEKRIVKGFWGLWQRIVDFANRHEMVIVPTIVYLFIFFLIFSSTFMFGWRFVQIPTYIAIFVVSYNIISFAIYQVLLKFKWGRYSPFVMPVVLCTLWAVIFLGVEQMTKSKLKADETISRISEIKISEIKNRLTQELSATTSELQKYMERLQSEDLAEHMTMKEEIGRLTIRKEQLSSEVASLGSLRNEQAKVLGRVYLEELERNMEEESSKSKQWDIFLNIIFLFLGIATGEAIRLLTKKLADKKKHKPLSL